MYHFDSAFVHSCIGTPPSSFPSSLFLMSTVAWIIQLLSASVLCHFVMTPPAASTTPQYHIYKSSWPPSTIAHSLLLTAKGGCPLNALISSATDWSLFFSGRPGPGLSPHQPSSRTSPDESTALSCRPFYGSRKAEVVV